MTVPDRSWYDPVLDATLHTGWNAVVAVSGMPDRAPLATDIETPGLVDTFTINCVTMAWHDHTGRMHSALLDVRRDRFHADAAATAYETASAIILHNAPFDVPPLRHAGLLTDGDIGKVVDTIVLARFAYPDGYGPMGSKKLENCAVRLLGMTDFKDGMEMAFKAAGYKTQQAGYEGMDIDAPVYRLGAMADTVCTLRLEPVLRQQCITHTLDHPFVDHGATTVAEAQAVLAVPETNHRVMMLRSAVGLAVDRDYLERYAEQVADERALHTAALAVHGLEGGSGKAAGLIKWLEDRGELPAGWPRTPKGSPRATKDDLDGLDHPLATAQRGLATTDKVLGYLAKVSAQARVTGRCHPMVGILGASATGRMSYGSPELQQFPKAARAIICDDGQGLTSIDWAQIEPVTMALMARDDAFLAPFEAGADLYEPIMRAATQGNRDLAKIVLLATMYGQGVKSLARRIGHTEESAAQIKRQMLTGTMPKCEQWMATVEGIASNHGKVVTAGGRILPVDADGAFRAVNYVVQGSAADVLMASIAELHRRGISQHVQLAMHDELVVDTEVAAEVQEVMLTPPPFLERWAGRTPVLRTDRADMGHQWKKV